MGWFGDRILNQKPRDSGFPCLVLIVGFVAKWAWAGWMTIEVLHG